jgi:uncharacterized membrane protein
LDELDAKLRFSKGDKPLSKAQTAISNTERLVYFLSERWLLVFSIIYGVFVGLPFLAPVLMEVGWEVPGRALYFVYSFLCHQLPQRSFFLFGSEFTYSLSEIQAVWQDIVNPLVLRQFTGNAQMGWKVAWSDRMVSMYTSIWFFGLIWWWLGKKRKPLPVWGFALFLLPMGLDGITHFISDLAGFGEGFRFSNLWLAELTNHVFPEGFYAGTTWGTFNSWMRFITGTLFGFGVVWFGFPYIDELFPQTRRVKESESY